MEQILKVLNNRAGNDFSESVFDTISNSTVVVRTDLNNIKVQIVVK